MSKKSEKVSKLEQEIKELKDQLAEQVKAEEFDKPAEDMKRYYDALITAGFREEQAWELFTLLMANATKPRNSIFGGI